MLSSKLCTTNSAAVWTISHTRLSVTSLEYHTIGVVPWGKVSPSPFSVLFVSIAISVPLNYQLDRLSRQSFDALLDSGSFSRSSAPLRLLREHPASFCWFLTVELLIFLHSHIHSRHRNTRACHTVMHCMHCRPCIDWWICWLDQSVASEIKVLWVFAVVFFEGTLCLVRLLADRLITWSHSC